MIEDDQFTIRDPAAVRPAPTHQALPASSTARTSLLGALAVAVAFGSLAAAGLGLSMVALVSGASTVIAGLVFLLSPLRGRPGGGHAVSAVLIGSAGCLLAAVLAGAGLEPAAVRADAAPGSTAPQGNESGNASNPGSPTESAAPRPVRVAPVAVAASGTAPDSVDGAGDPVSFAAEQLVDGDAGTAWRVAGTGVGEYVQFSLPRPVHVVAIEVIPGYAKRDPVTGENRFFQNRRVQRLLVSFDDRPGASIDLEDSPTLQKFPADADASTVTLEIESTTTAPRDYAAMSEVRFWAQA